MKVLLQEWQICEGGQLTSLSLNQESLDEAVKKLVPRKDPEDGFLINYEEAAEPDGDVSEIDIPDDSPFAEMVALRGHVFLHPDEMEIVWNSESH